MFVSRDAAWVLYGRGKTAPRLSGTDRVPVVGAAVLRVVVDPDSAISDCATPDSALLPVPDTLS